MVGLCSLVMFLFQAEDGIRDLVRSRGLGDVYKRQVKFLADGKHQCAAQVAHRHARHADTQQGIGHTDSCLLYTSDAADERSSVDLGGRRIIKKKNRSELHKRSTLSTEARDTSYI